MLKLAIAYFAIFSLVFISFTDCTRIQSIQRHEASVLNSSSKGVSFVCMKQKQIPGKPEQWCCLCDVPDIVCFYGSEAECQKTCLSQCGHKK
ncbi:hypothetical protein Hanom_Chr04g00314021 [Helianthus anomalus]